MDGEAVDCQSMEAALRACLPSDGDTEDVLAFIATDVAREIDHMPPKSDLTERSLTELEALPVFGLLSAHLGDLLGGPPPALLVLSILDAYWTPPLSNTADPAIATSFARPRECELCERTMPLTVHHLLPKKEHARLVKRGLSTLEECQTRTAMLCRPCHSCVHRAADTRQLADMYNTTEALLQLDEVVKFAAYASRQRPSSKGTRHGLQHAR